MEKHAISQSFRWANISTTCVLTREKGPTSATSARWSFLKKEIWTSTKKWSTWVWPSSIVTTVIRFSQRNSTFRFTWGTFRRNSSKRPIYPQSRKKSWVKSKKTWDNWTKSSPPKIWMGKITLNIPRNQRDCYSLSLKCPDPAFSFGCFRTFIWKHDLMDGTNFIIMIASIKL